MKRKILKTISKDDLEKLHTGTLMARRSQLLACEKSLDLSDQSQHAALDHILFKDDPQWEKAYRELKQVLATRENWPPNSKNKKREA